MASATHASVHPSGTTQPRRVGATVGAFALAALVVLGAACGGDGDRPSLTLPSVTLPARPTTVAPPDATAPAPSPDTTAAPAPDTTAAPAPAPDTTAPPDTTAAPAPDTTAPPDTTAAPPDTTAPPLEEETDGPSWWPVVLVAVALAAGVAVVVLVRRRSAQAAAATWDGRASSTRAELERVLPLTPATAEARRAAYLTVMARLQELGSLAPDAVRRQRATAVTTALQSWLAAIEAAELARQSILPPTAQHLLAADHDVTASRAQLDAAVVALAPPSPAVGVAPAPPGARGAGTS